MAKTTSIMLMMGALSNCATVGYQPLGNGGGYTDNLIDANTARITYYGSISSPDETVQNYLLYRCAQVTLKYGYDYFVIISSSTRPVVSSYTTPAMVNVITNKKGTASYGYVTGGQTMTYSRDIASAIIKMYSGTKPATMMNAFAARDIQKYITVKKTE